MKAYAYVTFVMRNDSFISGAIVLAHALKHQSQRADLVCLVTKDVSDQGRSILNLVFDYVVCTEEIVVQHTNQCGRKDRPYLFTRLQALRLGINGDLGFKYKKIVLLDADILPICDYDQLFDINTPAGIINEEKAHFVEKSSLQDGKLLWHDVYEPICSHGEKIPRYITDRVAENPKNLGVNACLWVLKPDYEAYVDILKQIRQPENVAMIRQFDWPEMQFMTHYWSGEWHNIDIRFASFNAQPRLSDVKGTHFAGLKPWQEKQLASLQHYSRYEDYQLWYVMFETLCRWHEPKLLEFSKVDKILKLIQHLRKEI